MQSIKKSLIITVLFLGFYTLKAQELTYMEPVANNFVRFYYDHNYNLIDKDCEFKSIERVAQYDSVAKVFHGTFKDFNKYGKLTLTGQYIRGVKHGEFKAFHPNMNVKWSVQFRNNQPTGQWIYYYPDGKPMLILEFLEDDEFAFLQFWDKEGNQKITDGNGEYEMTFPIDGFTDQGFTSYQRKGKIENGKLEGLWTTYFIDEKSKRTYPIFYELFRKGLQTSLLYDDAYQDDFIIYEDFFYVPTEFFPRAEAFITTDCTFDHFSRFYEYSRLKFAYYLEEVEWATKDRTFNVTAQYIVDKNGLPINTKFIKPTKELKYGERITLLSIFNRMRYFIPSVVDNKTIKDNIIIELTIQQVGKNLILKDFNMKREKGH